MSKGKSTKYKIATKHGILKGTFSGDQLDYRKNYTADILQIKPSELEKEKEMLSLHSMHKESVFMTPRSDSQASITVRVRI